MLPSDVMAGTLEAEPLHVSNPAGAVLKIASSEGTNQFADRRRTICVERIRGPPSFSQLAEIERQSWHCRRPQTKEAAKRGGLSIPV